MEQIFFPDVNYIIYKFLLIIKICNTVCMFNAKQAVHIKIYVQQNSVAVCFMTAVYGLC